MLYVTFFAAVLSIAAVAALGAAALAIESLAWRLIAGRSGKSRLWAAACRWPPVTVLLAAVCVAAITPAFRDLLVSAVTKDGKGAAGSEASKIMYLHYLPKEAEDINYSVRFNMALADFQISQADFLRWCQGRDCQLVQIGHPPQEQPVRVRHGSLDGEHELLVSDGLVCQLEPQQRHTIRIVFDRQRSRAYYEFRAW
jgi:hypothetical protein